MLSYLAEDKTLLERYKDHELVGNFFGHRECHIAPDWSLIYRLEGNEAAVAAVRTGSHSDLFKPKSQMPCFWCSRNQSAALLCESFK